MTTQIKLTEKQAAIITAMGAFFNYNTAADEKADNAVAVDLSELASQAGMNMKSARGVVGTLYKRGLLCEMEAGETGKDVCIGITDEGVDAYYEINPVVAGSHMAPEVAETDADEAEDDIDEALNEDEPKPAKKVSMCAAIRAAALAWKGTRTEFINAWHEAEGVHKGTLGTQWAKAHREGK